MSTSNCAESCDNTAGAQNPSWGCSVPPSHRIPLVAGQGLHAVAPTSLNVPEKHVAHSSAPTSENVPALHGVHSLSPDPDDRPIRELVQHKDQKRTCTLVDSMLGWWESANEASSWEER